MKNSNKRGIASFCGLIATYPNRFGFSIYRYLEQMETIKSITIETFIKPMKDKNISHGIAELDGRKLEIDLDKLYIIFGSNHFDLASIPGTKGGNRYFFVCPICGNRCRKLYKRLLLYGCGSCQKIHKSTLNRSKTDCQYYWERALREARKVEPGYCHLP